MNFFEKLCFDHKSFSKASYHEGDTSKEELIEHGWVTQTIDRIWKCFIGASTFAGPCMIRAKQLC